MAEKHWCVEISILGIEKLTLKTGKGIGENLVFFQRKEPIWMAGFLGRGQI
jgi:hypothetical protein|tara:strand:- start:113 stop:265 length:153 start_codon:yes stop_codon:yes gene_type:complete